MLDLEGPLFAFSGLQDSMGSILALELPGEKYDLIDVAGDNLVDIASDQLQGLGPLVP